MAGRVTADQGNGMKWRVMVELTGCDGTVRACEVGGGGGNTAECSARERGGLTLPGVFSTEASSVGWLSDRIGKGTKNVADEAAS